MCEPKMQNLPPTVDLLSCKSPTNKGSWNHTRMQSSNCVSHLTKLPAFFIELIWQINLYNLLDPALFHLVTYLPSLSKAKQVAQILPFFSIVIQVGRTHS